MMTPIDGFKDDREGGSSRMLVVVPDALDNVANFARQIYTQAATQQREVLYLALNSRESDPLAAARQLATLTALTQGSTVEVNSLQLEIEDWLDSLRQLTQPGDRVSLPNERLLAPRSLEKELGITQYVLPGIYGSEASRPRSGLNSLLFWLLGITILVFFSYLEFRITGMLGGLTLKAALILLISLELGAMYKLSQTLG